MEIRKHTEGIPDQVVAGGMAFLGGGCWETLWEMTSDLCIGRITLVAFQKIFTGRPEWIVSGYQTFFCR